jgi:hypothetical protein
MKKRSIQRNKLVFAKETIRQLVPTDLLNVAGGISCAHPTNTACDCSGSGTPDCYTYTGTDTGSTSYCTHPAV